MTSTDLWPFCHYTVSVEKTLIDKNLTKKDLRLQAHLTTNHIANMGKGEHISMQTLIKICETLNCDIADVIALVSDDDP